MSFATLDISKLTFDHGGASLEAARDVAQQWAAAFNAGDVDGLTELYDPAAALFPATDSEPIVGTGALRRFFASLGRLRPHARLRDEGAPRRLSERSAVVEGHYDFAGGGGERGWITAQYRLLLVRHIRCWRISEHHSTIMPVVAAA